MERQLSSTARGVGSVRELGIVNVNGGDTLITRRKPTITAVAPGTMPWGEELQIFAPNQNENVYTNDWQGRCSAPSST